MLPRADTKYHFWHPRVEMIPHSDGPRVDKWKNCDLQWVKTYKWDLGGMKKFEKRNLEWTKK